VRVPGRILILSSLAFALLTSFAIDCVSSPHLKLVLAVLSMVAIVLDAPRGLFRYNPADVNPLAQVPRGTTVLHLPPFDPGHFSGSVYTFLLTRNPGLRPSGYSPFVTPLARLGQATTVPLTNTPVDPCLWLSRIHALGIQAVAVHLDLYGSHPLQWPANGQALVQALDSTAGFTRLSQAGEVVVYRVDPEQLQCRLP
jgi:hypothetical protein